MKIQNCKSQVKYKHKVLIRVAIIFGIIVLLFAATFIPTLFLVQPGMHKMTGQYITLYYQNDKSAAQDIFNLDEKYAPLLQKKLGIASSPKIVVYVYDNLSTFQSKKYGVLVAILPVKWYDGDHIGLNTLIVAPSNDNSLHSYDNIVQTSLHEMVHSYNTLVNPRMTLWVDEGMAVYLSGQSYSVDLYQHKIPTINQIDKTISPITFGNTVAGYDFAPTYIEYLDKSFGWDKVMVFVKTDDYNKAFSKNENEIYNGWVAYLKQKYN